MESPLLGLILDSSVIIAAERKRQTIEEFLTSIGQRFGEVEIAISAVTLDELVHGVARANTPEIRLGRRSFIDELKKHVPVHPVTETTAEIAGQISGEQAAKGIVLPADDLLIGASAIEQGYAVATLNTRHFAKIPGLHVLSFGVWRHPINPCCAPFLREKMSLLRLAEFYACQSTDICRSITSRCREAGLFVGVPIWGATTDHDRVSLAVGHTREDRRCR